MPRRTGFAHAIAQSRRDAEQRRKAQLREQTQRAKELERAQKAYQKSQQLEEKDRARLYVESRVAEVELMNEQLEERISQLQGLLKATLDVDDTFDLDRLKRQPTTVPFDPGPVGTPEKAPERSVYEPTPLSAMQKLVPGAKARYAAQVAQAHQRYEDDMQAYAGREAERQAQLATLRQEYDQVIAGIQERTAAQHAEIDELKRAYAAGEPHAVVMYCSLVLESSVYPDNFPQKAKIAYVPESKQVVIEYDFPTIDCVPGVATYKYAKTKDEIAETARPAAQRKALYSAIIPQVTLRTLHELFEADRPGHIETAVFNGHVESIDLGTGRPVRTCVVTVRTTRDTFLQLDLSRVDPAACLKVLNASVSKSPSELAPVRPVLEFNMVDPRFIEEVDVLSSLDQRPNLMELSPTDFEALISNLFRAMGLESRLTQASRDGGVDCVAYDPRPIFGGKVIIQAKRYKHTVGVSAVRDLYGTLQNEGASKGILVTTSGYGKAAYDFANGKPLELLDGGNLLHLLAEHANITAKIQMPEDWKDPHPDAGA